MVVVRCESVGVAGSYRQLHARLRTNAEPVAFYGGIQKEGSLIVTKFKELVNHQVKLLNTQWRFAMWQVHLRSPWPPVTFRVEHVPLALLCCRALHGNEDTLAWLPPGRVQAADAIVKQCADWLHGFVAFPAMQWLKGPAGALMTVR